MKNNLLWVVCSYCLILLFATNTTAQKLDNVDLEWGKELKRPTYTTVKKVVGTDNDGMYVWRIKSRNRHYIEHYDTEMNLKKSNELDIEMGWVDKQIEDIVYFNGKLVLLTSFYSRKDDVNRLFAQSIDKKTMQLSKESPVIARIPARKSYNSGLFDYSISQDSTKLLIYNEMPYDRNGAQKMAFRVFDENFKLAWKKEVTLPYPDRLFSVKKYRIDEAGNVYVMGKLYKDKLRERRKGKPNYQYLVIAYTKDGADSKEYKINLEKEFISELTFEVAKNQDLICAGFYSERRSNGLKGAFYFRVNAITEKMYNIGVEPFSASFLAEFMSERRAAKGRELYNYDLDKLIMRSDGGALLIAEQFYIKVIRNQDLYGNWTESHTYYYNDIISVNINPDGSIAWTTRIPKRQIDATGIMSSYALTIARNKIYFIFNDNPKNLNVKDYKKIKNFRGRKSIVTLVALKPDGEYDKYALFSNRDFDIVTRPKICRQISKNEMVVYGEYRKRYKFGKVTFK